MAVTCRSNFFKITVCLAVIFLCVGLWLTSSTSARTSITNPLKTHSLSKLGSTAEGSRQNVDDKNVSAKPWRRVMGEPIPSNVEIHHVGFLKVHKAGSSTLQNIFLRFALDRDLTVILPKGPNHFFSMDRKTHFELLPLPKGRSHFDILACHSVFDEVIYSSVLPNNSVYIGIVRNPLEQMISAAFYFRDRYKERYLMRFPRENFISSLIRSEESTTFSLTKNAMARDFGFTETMIGHEDDTDQHLTYLNHSFNLVLLVEQFDVSLVMMRRMLNWNLKDIIYVVNNNFTHKAVNVSHTDQTLFERRNSLDYAVYNVFKKEFWRKINMMDSTFQEEVTHFKSVQKTVSDFCQRSTSPGEFTVQQSTWNPMFEVTAKTCHFMKIEELDFIDFHRKLVQSPQ